MSETCAVCKQGKGPEKCEVCGFSDEGVINREFPIPEDLSNWIETVVKPYRVQWKPESGFVWVEAGAFQMGSPVGTSNSQQNERPMRRVTLSGFWMCRHPVTQSEWLELMGSSVWQQRDLADEDFPMYGEGDKLPMYYVNFFEAVAYANRKSQRERLAPAYMISGAGDSRIVSRNPSANGYRLPTEAEWEYAARGGLYSEGNIYSGSDNVDEVAWYSENSGKNTQELCTKKPNGIGLYDMSGNVWEWCWDLWGKYPRKDEIDPEGAPLGDNRVIRGGSWNSSAAEVRSANRDGIAPSSRDSDLGFRLVRSI